MKKPALLGAAIRYSLVVAVLQQANLALAEVSKPKDSGLGQFAVQYSDELLVAACIFLMIISSFIGVFYKTPVYGGKPLPMWLKAPVCIAGGFIAFLFCLHVDKALTLLTPIYVGAVSFISPAVIHLVHAVLVQKFGLRLGVDEELLKKLEANASTENG
ncbi:hypothetical protein [Acinetobacter chengduensis]|uniref:hypothetical protein n=1 Tax=Acinetobacter chengduensis TaxID=2420890 RepID=UPI0011C381C8|nr:hypothetical protein [Acinetobacter chengduensis]